MIAIVGVIGVGVADAVVVRRQIDGDSRQAVGQVVVVARPRQCPRGRRLQVGEASDDLGDPRNIPRCDPVILGEAAVRGRRAVKAVAVVREGDRAILIVGLLRDPPRRASGRIDFVRFGDRRRAIVPGPCTGRAVVSQPVVGTRAVGRDIGCSVVAIGDDRAIARLALHGAAHRIEPAAVVQDAARRRLLPAVVVGAVIAAQAVVRTADRHIRSAPDQEFVALADDQIAIGRVDHDLLARAALRTRTERTGRAEDGGGAALRAGSRPCKDRNHSPVPPDLFGRKRRITPPTALGSAGIRKCLAQKAE